MYMLTILLFFGALVLALGVIRDMLVTHGEQIITALAGEQVFPEHGVIVVKFRAQSAAKRSGYRPRNRDAAIRSSLPLALAA
jgi:hypothetical protein